MIKKLLDEVEQNIWIFHNQLFFPSKAEGKRKNGSARQDELAWQLKHHWTGGKSDKNSFALLWGRRFLKTYFYARDIRLARLICPKLYIKKKRYIPHRARRERRAEVKEMKNKKKDSACLRTKSFSMIWSCDGRFLFATIRAQPPWTRITTSQIVCPITKSHVEVTFSLKSRKW